MMFLDDCIAFGGCYDFFGYCCFLLIEVYVLVMFFSLMLLYLVMFIPFEVVSSCG